MTYNLLLLDFFSAPTGPETEEFCSFSKWHRGKNKNMRQLGVEHEI